MSVHVGALLFCEHIKYIHDVLSAFDLYDFAIDFYVPVDLSGCVLVLGLEELGNVDMKYVGYLL